MFLKKQSGGVLAPLPDDTTKLRTADENRVYFVTMPNEQWQVKSLAEKEKVFKQFFGSMNDRVFNFIEKRLTNGV